MIARVAAIGVAASVLLTNSPTAASASAETAPRITLKVLLLSDGEPMSEAFADRMDAQSIPYTRIDLTDADRPAITADMVRASDSAGQIAHYQAIIAPSAAPPSLTDAETAELTGLQRDFGVRRYNAYVWPNAASGMLEPRHSGSVDGAAARLSTQASGLGFSYLRGAVAIDNVDPDVTESYGYFAQPAGPQTTPVLTAPIPGASGEQATLIGIHRADGIEQMFATFASNSYQTHFQKLAPGVLNWVTRGVHLGAYRNSLSVQSDDVFVASSQWNIEQNCTEGYDCAHEGTPARMNASDVTYLRDWQRRNSFLIDQAYNANGVAEAGGESADPLYRSFAAYKKDFRWVNHTYSHLNLGCLKTVDGPGWQCQRDSAGNVIWRSLAEVDDEAERNLTWARRFGFSVDRSELVTGEHSGLKALPQVTDDNPNLLSTLGKRGVTWIASDASREQEQRQAGAALTVPRYPGNVFYNTPTREQAADLYNWIYTSRADGGSGLCEDNPQTSTCIAPLDLATGWRDYIVPQETRAMVSRMVSSDPRPFYNHQANYTQDRIAYDVISAALRDYRAAYATNAPVINPTLAQAGRTMQQQARFAKGASQVTGVLQGRTVTLTFASGEKFTLPVTAPTGTTVRGADQTLSSYAGSLSGWINQASSAPISLTLSSDVGYAAAAPQPASTARSTKLTPTSPSHRRSDTSERPATTVIAPARPLLTPDPSSPQTQGATRP